jgi:CMP-N-acetylneuraminic acid synthetase
MILGVIPARGGSKGVPRKNIRPLSGRPLIEWTIESAMNSKLLDRFVVSTEDHEIAEVAQGAGAEVLWRPAELASDSATTIALMQHIALELNPDHVVLLQPTSPVRIHSLIDRAIKRFFECDVDTLATGFITYLYEWGTMNNIPRQLMKGWFYDDGNVYVHRAAHIKAGEWLGAKREPMVTQRYYNIEIDEEADFWIYEGIIQGLQRKYGSLL